MYCLNDNYKTTVFEGDRWRVRIPGATRSQSLERRGIADIQSGASNLGKIYNTWRGSTVKLVREKGNVRGMACTFMKLFEL